MEPAEKEVSKHKTHEASEEQTNQRQENVAYKPMGEAHGKFEIEEEKGEYDEDGFYILESGAFYDPDGYYFDEEGYDEYGGFYDDSGYYVPGQAYAKEYYENAFNAERDEFGEELEEETGETEEPDEEEKATIEEELNMIVAPAVAHLKSTGAPKPVDLKISNLLERMGDQDLEKFLKKDFPELKYSQLLVRKDKSG